MRRSGMGRCSAWSRWTVASFSLTSARLWPKHVLADAATVLVADVDRACPATVLALVDGALARSTAGHGAAPERGDGARLGPRWAKRIRSRSVQNVERRASRVRNTSPHSRHQVAPGLPSLTRRRPSSSCRWMGTRSEPQIRVSRTTSPSPPRSSRTSVATALARYGSIEPPLQLQQAIPVGRQAPFSLARIWDGQVVAHPGPVPGVLGHRQAWQLRRDRGRIRQRRHPGREGRRRRRAGHRATLPGRRRPSRSAHRPGRVPRSGLTTEQLISLDALPAGYWSRVWSPAESAPGDQVSCRARAIPSRMRSSPNSNSSA